MWSFDEETAGKREKDKGKEMPTEGQRRICKKNTTKDHHVDRPLVSRHSCDTDATAKSRAKRFSVVFIDIESKFLIMIFDGGSYMVPPLNVSD